MPYTSQELQVIGARIPTSRLLHQTAVSVEAATTLGGELAARFPQARTAELAALAERIRSLSDARGERRIASITGTNELRAAVRAATRWAIDLVAAADNCFEDDPPTRALFHQTSGVKNSVPRMIARMQQLLTLAAHYEQDLAAWGVTADDLAQGQTRLADLTAATATHQQAMASLPPRLAELCEAKGQAYLLLKRLARAGRRTFADMPEKAEALRLGLLRPRRTKPDGDAQPAAAKAQRGTTRVIKNSRSGAQQVASWPEDDLTAVS